MCLFEFSKFGLILKDLRYLKIVTTLKLRILKAEKYFTSEQKEMMVRAIEDAEKDCSGEVRIHIENHSKGDVLDRAADVFAKLEMHKTALRNGVLIYVAIEDHTFAIIGDAGINSKVPANFWDEIKDEMAKRFREGKIAEGVSEAVRRAGLELKKFFPYQKDDVNELPDDISFKNN